MKNRGDLVAILDILQLVLCCLLHERSAGECWGAWRICCKTLTRILWMCRALKGSLHGHCCVWLCSVPVAFVWIARWFANASISVGMRGLVAGNSVAVLIPSWIARILSVGLYSLVDNSCFVFSCIFLHQPKRLRSARRIPGFFWLGSPFVQVTGLEPLSFMRYPKLAHWLLLNVTGMIMFLNMCIVLISLYPIHSSVFSNVLWTDGVSNMQIIYVLGFQHVSTRWGPGTSSSKLQETVDAA